MRKIFVLATVGVVLAGCSREPTGRDVGSFVGATAGILLGSQVDSSVGRAVAMLGLAAMGSWLGGEIGEHLSNEDRKIAGMATQEALGDSETGKTTVWSNPDTGASGKVTPGPTYLAKSGSLEGRQCRDIKVAVSPKDHPTQQASRTACRKPNGDWEILGA